MLRTETPSTAHADLDTYDDATLLAAFIDDQHQAVDAVRAASGALQQALALALPRMLRGGRLIYVGAGTSGRLGVLDGVELLPTFSWPNERALGVMAGGRDAMYVAVEGAEDDREQGALDLLATQPGADDVVLLLAASGATPYVLGALHAARKTGALTVGFANNPGAPVAQEAEVGVILDTGPEVISGSTRLKAGTAQKIALNTFSSALMVRLGKVYGNLMVDLKATNAKLRRRAIALTMLASGANEADAVAAFDACGQHVKLAVASLRLGLPADAAQARLDAAGGHLRAALAQTG